MNQRLTSILTAGLVLGMAGPAVAATIDLTFVTAFTPTDRKTPMEKAFVESLEKNPNLGVKIKATDLQVLGIKEVDTLRFLGSGAFDIMNIPIGRASGDDPFFEGLDLVGVSTKVPDLKVAVEAYRKVFDERLQKKFNAKVLALWPFGTQVFYCNKAINSLDDLKGLKVRTFTPTMAALVEHLGATSVSIQFSEVYPALQRGVANCGVTSPTSGNIGKWPEVTTHQLPVSVAGSVQGYMINLEKWKKFNDAQKKIVETEFKKFEDQLWQLAETLNADAINCNTGKDPCKEHQKFNMTLVSVSPKDEARIKDAVTTAVLPLWADKCDKIDPQCSKVWNDTVGKARGFAIKK